MDDNSRSKQPVRLAFPPGHFYSPIVDPDQAADFLQKIASDICSLPSIALNREAMVTLWRSFSAFVNKKPFHDLETEGHIYWFMNPHFSYGDATLLYCMLRHFLPNRVIEIGSGYSSACMIETADRFISSQISFTFIDPDLRLFHKVLHKYKKRTHNGIVTLEQNVQEAPLSIFSSLNSGDILFIDSTHVLKTGSDVCFELFKVMPVLKSGVIIHFHDIFWPFEYGKEWAIDENRSWNETYAIRAFLSYNEQFEIVFFNDFFGKFHTREIEATAPWVLKNTGGSLWLRRC